MSDKKIGEIVNNLLDGIHGISKSETIIGEPQQAGDATVIPVHRLKVAFGAGEAGAGAHGQRAGGDYGAQGAGGAIELDPVAAIAVGKDGHAHILTVEADSGTAWAKLLGEVPDMMGRVAAALGNRVTHELETRSVDEVATVGGGEKAEALPAKNEED